MLDEVPSRDRHFTIQMPTSVLRDSLATAVAERIAALTDRPDISIRDIRVVDDASEPILHVTVRPFKDPNLSDDALLQVVVAMVREYASDLDLSAMSIILRPD